MRSLDCLVHFCGRLSVMVLSTFVDTLCVRLIVLSTFVDTCVLWFCPLLWTLTYSSVMPCPLLWTLAYVRLLCSVRFSGYRCFCRAAVRAVYGNFRQKTVKILPYIYCKMPPPML